MVLDKAFEYYSLMRRNSPVFFNKEKNVWEVYSYEDVRTVLMQDRIFSSNPEYRNVKSAGSGISFITMDNPEHKEMRNIVAPYFMPTRINDNYETVKNISGKLLDSMTINSDIVSDYAIKLPVTVISELLGIPEEQRGRFREWSDYIIGNKRDSNFQKLNNYMIQELSKIFMDGSARNIMDVINNGIVSGRNLDLREKISYIMLLIIGGNETTTNLITGMVRVLSDHPEIQDEIRGDNSLVKKFIEETLRFYSPIQLLPHRFAREDVNLNGKNIKKGDQVMVYLGSANRDEKVFDDSEIFDLNRKFNAHLAFGTGIHMCIGAPLARLEAGIACTGLLEKFAGIKIDYGRSHMLENPMVYGFDSMHLMQ